MPNPNESAPGDHEFQPSVQEIQQQLDRMLSSARFRGASNPADFLAFVVTRALKGKKSPEDIIGRNLLGAKFSKDVTTDVRVTAHHLRKALGKYYESEGAEDPVIIVLPNPPGDKSIRLPRGESYCPIFTYNRRNEI